MADQQAARVNLGAQNTGNPVLDSTVNIITAICLSKYGDPTSLMETLHERLLKLAEKEPGGLRRTTAII